MTESYALAFIPGSSGRFISDVIWSLTHGEDFQISFSMFNSSHNSVVEKCYGGSVLYTTEYDEVDYKNLEWNKGENIGLFRTHRYPNFDDADNNPELAFTKFIIIKVSEQDMLECFANENYKNHIQGILGGPGVNFFPSWIYDEYVRNFGNISLEDFPAALTPDVIQVIILKLYDDYVLKATDSRHHDYRGDFFNPIVPEEYASRTLILDYSDIYKKSATGYVALDEISKFLNKEPTEYIKSKFKEYVSGRAQFLKSYLYNLIG